MPSGKEGLEGRSEDSSKTTKTTGPQPKILGARFGAKQAVTKTENYCAGRGFSYTARFMACRGSAVRIRLAPLNS